MNTASQKTVLHHDSVVQRQNRAMLLPNVPDALYDDDHQGLLMLDKLITPLRVECEVWFDVRQGDTYQLLWNNTPIGIIKTITTEQPGVSVFLEVPVQLLVEGVHDIAYRITDPENHAHTDSASVTVEIDLTAPGLPELGPIKFPEVIKGGLTSAELAGLGDQLVAAIGSYAGIYQHDVIRTFWGDIEGPGAIVSKTDTGLNLIRVIYSKAFLLSLGNFDGFVTYTVTDRAGNVSQLSLGTHVQLLLNDVLEYFKALIPSDKTTPEHYTNNVVNITLRLQSAQFTQPN